MNWKMFLIVAIIIVTIWGSLFYYMIQYGDDVKKDPCSVCAKRMGEKVTCVVGDIDPQTRIYYPSGEIEDESTGSLQHYKG